VGDVEAAARSLAVDTIEIDNPAAWPAILARLAEAGVGKRDLYRARTIAWALRDGLKRPRNLVPPLLHLPVTDIPSCD